MYYVDVKSNLKKGEFSAFLLYLYEMIVRKTFCVVVKLHSVGECEETPKPRGIQVSVLKNFSRNLIVHLKYNERLKNLILFFQFIVFL